MAFLRETVGSLRAYFIIVATLSGAINLLALVSGLPTVRSVGNLGFAVAYLYLGVRLKQLLSTSPGQITGVLIAGAIYLVLLLVLYALIRLPEVLVQPFVGLLVTWYLFRSVKRLVADANPPRAATPGPSGA